MTKDKAMKQAKTLVTVLLTDDVISKQEAEILRQALEQPDMGIDRGAWDDVPDATKWVDELRGDDETEQEPVAWRWLYEGKPDSEKHFPMPAPDADIVAIAAANEFPRTVQFLYTAPPKREWVGLTDEEIAEGQRNSWVHKSAFESAAWWAEEKLRAKNGF